MTSALGNRGPQSLFFGRFVFGLTHSLKFVDRCFAHPLSWVAKEAASPETGGFGGKLEKWRSGDDEAVMMMVALFLGVF